MKKIKFKPYLYALIILLLSTVCLAVAFSTTKPASAGTTRITRLYSHPYLSGYAVEMDIKSDRSIAVTEDITVYHYNNTGVIRDIPLNAGELIKNVRVSELKGGVPSPVFYDVFVEDSSFLSIDIGDSSYKNDEHTYRIKDDYCLTKAQEGANALALTPIGTGWNCEITNISVKIKLPEGYVANSVNCFYQSISGNVETAEIVTETVDSRTVISFEDYENVILNYALRFDLEFEEGALTTYFDFTPYWFVIAAAVILLFVIALKFLAFNKGTLTPVINFEAPNKMNPLLMGKLIDGKIDSEDITSMIFYWADKGYLKINLDDQRDPAIIRIVKALPQDAPDYEQLMFAEMFDGQDAIKPSMLKYKFYRTVDRVTKTVNDRTKELYEKKSVILSYALALLGGLMLGLAPLVLALSQISLHYLIIAPFIAIVPLFFVNVFSMGLVNNKYKSKKGVKIAFICAAIGISALTTLFYTLFVPSFILGIIPKILLCLIACATAGTAVIIITRTKEYTEQLNEIVGFKNFIELVEKDKLEKLLEDDPQFYYHVLPYAQVLGVSDKWEDKFKDITVQPPQWATSSTANTLFNFYIFNSIMRASMSNMTSNFVSRPSSSGVSGGGHGSFGGFSGGGHGGGGGRFR